MLVYSLSQQIKDTLAANSITDFEVYTVTPPPKPSGNYLWIRETGASVGQLGLHFSTVNFQIAGYTKTSRERLQTVIFKLYDSLVDKYQIEMVQPSGMTLLPAANRSWHAQYLRRTNRPTFVQMNDWLCYVFTCEVFLSEDQ